MYLPAALTLLRPAHWVKNAFVVAPLFLTPSAVSWSSVAAVLGGFAAFSALASAVYILNDYVDREADRKHPKKCFRPLAAGTVSVPLAFALFILLLAGGLGLAMSLSPSFAKLAAAYFAMNLAYSLWLKHFAIIDVILIAIGFVLRVEGGAMLAGIEASVWIVIATGLLALFLGLGKRRDDLVNMLDIEHRRSIDGYNKPFLDTAIAVVLGGVLVTYLIYATDAEVMHRLGTDKVFYTTPFVVAGIMRYLQIIFVEERSGSPTRLVLRDRFLILTILGWIAIFGGLIYG